MQGPSAVIFQSPCIWLKKNDRVARVNMHKCTGCKKCITEIGCPAIRFDMQARGAKSGKRGQARIDVSQCNGCSLCAQVCPFQAIRVFKREELETLDPIKELEAGRDAGAARMTLGSVSEDGEAEYAPDSSQQDAKIEGTASPSPAEGPASEREPSEEPDETPEEALGETREAAPEATLEAALDGLFGGQVFVNLEEGSE